MAHRIGALLMPAPAPPFGPAQPDRGNSEALDPALTVLGDFFQALLEHYCGPAWESIGGGEPVVRHLSIGYDPEDIDFSDTRLPMLALWRESDGAPTRLTDGASQQSSVVNVLWIPSPANEQVMAARSPFFNAFSKAMLLAYQHERDPCWIKPGEESNVVARTYGSYVWGHAGLDSWTYSGTKRVPVQVTGAEMPYPGWLATWSILESSDSDASAFGSTLNGTRIGTERTSIAVDITTATDIAEEDPEPLLLQQLVIPPDQDP